MKTKLITNKDETPAIIQNTQKERYCPECNTKVTPKAEICQTCQKNLFKQGLSAWKAGCIGYLFGGLMAGIALGILHFMGLESNKIKMIIFAAVFFSAWMSKKDKLKSRRDLALWKPIAPTRD